MARRSRASIAAEEAAAATQTADEAPAAAPVQQRRRRRTASTDTAHETGVLIDAVLRSRGAKGATQEVLQSVIAWARGIREEGEALRELSGRPRRQKAQAPSERIARYDMNRALLDGILGGVITLDVLEGGTIVFLHRNLSSADGKRGLAEADVVVSPS